MSNKSRATNKNTSKKKTTEPLQMGNTPGMEAVQFSISRGLVEKPSLKDVLSGSGEAVAKAVAERTATRLAAEAKDKPAKKEKKVVAEKPVAKKGTKTSEKKETLAAFMRRLIVEGRNNEEVFDAAVKEFGIGDEKKSYPSWYRSEMKRKQNAARDEAKKTNAKGKELPNVEKVATKKHEPKTKTIMVKTVAR